MWTRSLSITTLAALAVLAGCETVNLEFCDKKTLCTAPNTICDYEQNRCVPAADAGGKDVGPDGVVLDGGGDAYPDISPDQAAPKKNGLACGAGDECQSGFCVDGYCCGSACDTTCVSCAIKGKEGTCSPYDPHTDPEGECRGSHSDCGGSCDGSGTCLLAAPAKPCGAPVCLNAELETGACDGLGVCVRSKASCGGYNCADASKCREGCTSASECTGVFQCLAGSCIANLPLGAACGANNKACDSGNCVDGVCCSSGACSACHRCDLPGTKKGSCHPVADGTACGSDSCLSGLFLEPACQSGQCKNKSTSCEPYRCNAGGTACIATCSGDPDCASGHYCDAGGKCSAKKSNGEACSTKAECSSGVCTAEGYCCDRACAGACETCAGKPACTFKAAGSKCGPADACKDDLGASYVEVHACDGSSGSCKTTKQDCGAFACGQGLNCKKSCSTNQDCSSKVCGLWDGAAAHQCVPQSQVCYVQASAVAGTGTLASPYDELTDCPPGSPAVIGVLAGTYTTGLTATNTIVTGVDVGSKLYDSGGILTAKAVVQGKLVVGSGGTLMVYGLDMRGKIEASTAQRLEVRRTRLQGLTSGLAAADTPNVVVKDVEVDGTLNGVRQAQGSLFLEDVRIVNTSNDALYMEGGALTASDLAIESGSKQVGLKLSDVTMDLSRVSIQGGSYGVSITGGMKGSIANLLVSGAKEGVVATLLTQDVHVQHATIVGCSQRSVLCDDKKGRIVLSNSIVALGGEVHANCVVSYSAHDQAMTGIANIVVADPLFVNAAQKDFRLLPSSPCVDKASDFVAGAPNPTTDLDGNPRRVKKMQYVNTADMGAYELQ